MDTCIVLLVVFLAALAYFCRLRWQAAQHECDYYQRMAAFYQGLYYQTLERLPAQQASVIPPPSWN